MAVRVTSRDLHGMTPSKAPTSLKLLDCDRALCLCVRVCLPII